MIYKRKRVYIIKKSNKTKGARNFKTNFVKDWVSAG